MIPCKNVVAAGKSRCTSHRVSIWFIPPLLFPREAGSIPPLLTPSVQTDGGTSLVRCSERFRRCSPAHNVTVRYSTPSSTPRRRISLVTCFEEARFVIDVCACFGCTIVTSRRFGLHVHVDINIFVVCMFPASIIVVGVIICLCSVALRFRLHLVFDAIIVSLCLMSV